MHTISTPIAGLHQLLPMQRLADARRVLEISLDASSFAQPEDRHALRQAKRIAWAIIAEVAEELVSTLDVAAGDPDFEDGTDVEDEGLTGHDQCGRPLTARGPGCNLADAGEDEHDRENIHEREPEDGF